MARRMSGRRTLMRSLAGGVAVAVLGLIGPGAAQTLDPERAAGLVVTAQRLAGAFDAAWQALDVILPPLCGPRVRLRLAQLDGSLQQILGSPQYARAPWHVAANLAERRYDSDGLYFALEQEAEVQLVLGDYAATAAVAERIARLAEHAGNLRYQALAEGYFGILARRRGALDEARRHHETSLALRRSLGDPAEVARALSNLGTVYKDQGDFARAMELQLEALDLRRKLGPYERLDVTQRNLALLYREIEDTEQARISFDAALKAAQERHDPAALAPVLGSYASFSNDLGDAQHALTLARQALAIDESLGNRPHAGLEHVEIGRALLALGRGAEALAELDRGLKLGRELNQREITGAALLYRGVLALREGAIERAAQDLDAAIDVLRDSQLKPQLMEAYGARETVAAAANDHVRALDFAHKRASLREELLGARSSRQLSALKLRYERAEADQRIHLLSLDNEVQGLRLREQLLVRNVFIVGAGVLAILALILFGRYRATRVLNVQLQRKNAEISAKESSLAEANRRLTTQTAELYQAAITDPLTGVYNRGHLLRQLEERVRHCAREQRALAVLLIDFDHFKQVNDQLGHQFGDRVLESGVQVMRQWLEPGDMLGRYGGEEFVAVLDDHDLDAASAVAERLRRKVEMALASLGGATRSFTISIGVACLADCPEATVEALLGAADAAVYRAKALGRNRVAHAA